MVYGVYKMLSSIYVDAFLSGPWALCRARSQGLNVVRWVSSCRLYPLLARRRYSVRRLNFIMSYCVENKGMLLLSFGEQRAPVDSAPGRRPGGWEIAQHGDLCGEMRHALFCGLFFFNLWDVINREPQTLLSSGAGCHKEGQQKDIETETKVTNR